MPSITQIAHITRRGGELLRKLSLQPKMRLPQWKEDGSPLTPADLELNRYLIKALTPLGYPVISEESEPAPPAPKPQDSYFLVDPLDGTKSFCQGGHEFALCVGFLREGRPYAGAIYDPTESCLYWAQKGQGAFMDQHKIGHPGVQGRPLRVYSSGDQGNPYGDDLVETLGIGEILEKSSALKYCHMAKGGADLYVRLEPTYEWDTAAAQVLLEEAGCVLLDGPHFKPLTYGKKDSLNGGIVACHASLKEKVEPWRDKFF